MKPNDTSLTSSFISVSRRLALLIALSRTLISDNVFLIFSAWPLISCSKHLRKECHVKCYACSYLEQCPLQTHIVTFRTSSRLSRASAFSGGLLMHGAQIMANPLQDILFDSSCSDNLHKKHDTVSTTSQIQEFQFTTCLARW